MILRNIQMRQQHFIAVALVLIATTFSFVLFGQGPPRMRKHQVTKASALTLVPANKKPPTSNRVQITEKDGFRVIESNDIPKHTVGEFPNRGNPNAIAAQNWTIRIPLHPVTNKESTSLHLRTERGPPNMPFGIGVNGVLFEPGTAEFWMGNRSADWNYEALGGAVRLGLDSNHAHVQPGGMYHYHGIPTGLLNELGFTQNEHQSEKHSPLLGWAADGFPVYYAYGYSHPDDPKSPITQLTTGFQLKEGNRPGGSDSPGGRYDGAFIQDYEFAEGTGDLDECNGRFCITPEFLDGTYAYFLTEAWPVIPRAFRGTPVLLKERGHGAHRRPAR
ncbi:YHYH protein [Pirellulales bacterium]|nr:YHYH protein [Pirellulales bacterium]